MIQKGKVFPNRVLYALNLDVRKREESECDWMDLFCSRGYLYTR